MTVHKLHFDEFDQIDYQLIAIHTFLEDYLLAFCINQKLPVNLKKSDCDIQIRNKEGESQFTRFIYEDEKAVISWNLIQNKNDVMLSPQGIDEGLFAESKFSTTFYFIPEFKKVDYFLKIENGNKGVDVTKITNELKKIDRISTIYPVDVEKIKSKNNLIF